MQNNFFFTFFIVFKSFLILLFLIYWSIIKRVVAHLLGNGFYFNCNVLHHLYLDTIDRDVFVLLDKKVLHGFLTTL